MGERGICIHQGPLVSKLLWWGWENQHLLLRPPGEEELWSCSQPLLRGVEGGRVTLTAWQYGWSRERGKKNYLDLSLFLVPNLSVTPWPNLCQVRGQLRRPWRCSPRTSAHGPQSQAEEGSAGNGGGGGYRVISKWFSATCVCACPQHHFCSLPINSKACFVSVYIFH